MYNPETDTRSDRFLNNILHENEKCFKWSFEYSNNDKSMTSTCDNNMYKTIIKRK